MDFLKSQISLYTHTCTHMRVLQVPTDMDVRIHVKFTVSDASILYVWHI